MRIRGFSLALVLLVASIAITVGFAVAALSSFSLNLAAQTLNQARAAALARAVAAELCYEMDQRVWKKNPWGRTDFPDLSYGADAMRQRFRTLPLFPDPDPHVMDGPLRAWVDFDRPDYFSVDNLNFPEPCPGWLDKGTTRTSVPAFCLSLVVSTGIGESPDKATDLRHFESVICRAWPYAAYGLKPPLQLGSGTVIRGGLYDRTSDVRVGTAGTAAVSVQGDISVLKGRATTKITTTESSTVSGRVNYGVPPPVGPTLGAGDDGELAPVGVSSFQIPVPEGARESLGRSAPQHLDPFNANPLEGLNFTPELATPACTISVLELWLVLGKRWPLLEALLPPIVQEMLRAQVSQEIRRRITIWHGNPPQPVEDAFQFKDAISFRFPLASGDASVGFGAYGEKGALNTLVLVEKVTKSDGVYYVPYSMTNHFGLSSGEGDGTEDLWTGTEEGPSDVTLKDAVLIVLGDLDIRGLKGDNSALYVTGNLFLRGGKLESGNKGMLVLANNVIIDADGEFRGVIAARGNMKLKPLPGTGRLTIRGAVLAEGNAGTDAIQDSTGATRIVASAPLLIDNTTIQLDRKYTKALNRVGLSRRLVFREVP